MDPNILPLTSFIPTPTIQPTPLNPAPTTTPPPTSPLPNFLSPEPQPPTPTLPSPNDTSSEPHLSHEHTLSTSQSAAEVPLPAPFAETHSMNTRGKSGIFKPKKLFSVTKYPLQPSIEPTCVSQAL